MLTQDTKEREFFTEDIFNPAYIGVQNANAYIGAVLNKNNIFNIKKWNINEYWELIPQLNQNNELIFQKFQTFVIKNALCEMITCFEETLIELYDNIISIHNILNNAPYNINEHLKIMKEFKRKNFEKKIKKIKKLIDIETKNENLWVNLKYIRNNIIHNNSIVNKDSIEISIPRYIYTLFDEDTKMKYQSSLEEPIFKIGKIQGHKVRLETEIYTVKKNFKNGETITFTPAETYYLINTLNESIKDLEILCINYFTKNKIEFGIKKKNGIIKTQKELENQHPRNKVLHMTLYPPSKTK